MKRIILGMAGFAAATEALAAEPKGAVPLGNPGEWVTSGDYPASALRDEMQGAVSFVLRVDPAGRVENCTVTVSSGHAILDDTACNLITQRAIFRPATDKRNRPVAGTYANRVRWVLPDPSPEDDFLSHPESTLDVTLLLDVDGKVLECEIKSANGVFKDITKEKPGPCENPPPVGPMPDASGKPQKRRVHLLFNVKVDPVP